MIALHEEAFILHGVHHHAYPQARNELEGEEKLAKSVS